MFLGGNIYDRDYLMVNFLEEKGFFRTQNFASSQHERSYPIKSEGISENKERFAKAFYIFNYLTSDPDGDPDELCIKYEECRLFIYMRKTYNNENVDNRDVLEIILNHLGFLESFMKNFRYINCRIYQENPRLFYLYMDYHELHKVYLKILDETIFIYEECNPKKK